MVAVYAGRSMNEFVTAFKARTNAYRLSMVLGRTDGSFSAHYAPFPAGIQSFETVTNFSVPAFDSTLTIARVNLGFSSAVTTDRRFGHFTSYQNRLNVSINANDGRRPLERIPLAAHWLIYSPNLSPPPPSDPNVATDTFLQDVATELTDNYTPAVPPQLSVEEFNRIRADKFLNEGLPPRTQRILHFNDFGQHKTPAYLGRHARQKRRV